jgi:hypothetical protein
MAAFGAVKVMSRNPIAYGMQRRARPACFLEGTPLFNFVSRNGGRVAPSADGPARALP